MASLTEPVYRQAGHLVTGEVNGEVVALDVSGGECYGLNKVGSRVWSLLATPASLREICAILVKEYEIDVATCEREVSSLLDDLRAAGLITLQEVDRPSVR